jgi:hypothetical protein
LSKYLFSVWIKRNGKWYQHVEQFDIPPFNIHNPESLKEYLKESIGSDRYFMPQLETKVK